jgi:hypothetical protein
MNSGIYPQIRTFVPSGLQGAICFRCDFFLDFFWKMNSGIYPQIRTFIPSGLQGAICFRGDFFRKMNSGIYPQIRIPITQTSSICSNSPRHLSKACSRISRCADMASSLCWISISLKVWLFSFLPFSPPN